MPEPPKVKLRDRFINTCRTRRVSLSTERAYWSWAKRFVHYHHCKSCDDLCDQPQDKFASFITSLARADVSVSTQMQAWNALLFLYERVLGQTLGDLPKMERAIRPARLPSVPATHENTMKILNLIHGTNGLALRLIYGSCLRVTEGVRIRLKDLDFAHNEIIIRDGKGGKDGVVPMPKKLKPELLALVKRREAEHDLELTVGEGWVWLPNLYGVKNPKAHFSSEWQYLFAAEKQSLDPLSGNRGRHHILAESLQYAMRQACHKLRLRRTVTPHGLRHAGAREIERRGTPPSEIQRLLRHKNIETTSRYLGISEPRVANVKGPLD